MTGPERSAEPEHSAARPSWDCRACDQPWPCDPAREALVEEMDSVQLAMYLWVNLEEAAGDMPTMPPVEAFDRFLSWSRTRAQSPATEVNSSVASTR